MMLSRILVLLICIYVSTANAGTCLIKPILKDFDSTTFPSLNTKITSDIIIKTPIPTNIAPFLPFYVFGDDPVTAKTITFSAVNNTVDGYAIKDLILKAFGATTATEKELPVMAYRYNWITCDNLPIEIKLTKNSYRAFLVKRISKKDVYDLYVIPNSNNSFVYSLQFSKFSESEVNNILGTLRIIADK